LRSSSSCPKTYLRVDQFNGGGSPPIFFGILIKCDVFNEISRFAVYH
jgi:hypothetical protein